MAKYEPVIGMEIHIELNTKTKMFCGCENGFGLEEKPNIHICPVCTGQPGALPVINEEAVKKVIKTALALNCRIPELSKFDRKNYFYPDLPKGYQISQYDKPLSVQGFIEVDSCKIRITRIHLEEDTGKLVHPAGASHSLVDFNRAGVPLMELVTEADLRSAAETKKFCQELQLVLRYLGVSDADMEKGQMRCEVNISLRPEGSEKFGTKVEIKNLNSFRAVERGIEFEIKRQAEALEAGEKIIQETRGWVDGKQKTVSQRTKEEAHDYRYFPEPDLPPLEPQKIMAEIGPLPELPEGRRKRFAKEYNLPAPDIEVLVIKKEMGDFFEQAVSELGDWAKVAEPKIEAEKLMKLMANYLITELQKLLTQSGAEFKNLKISPENYAEFIKLTAQGVVSSSGAQSVLKEMFETGADPSHIIEEKGLAQMSEESELENAVAEVISQNPGPAQDFKNGKEKVLMFLVGKVMAQTKGRANPQVVEEILKKRLK
ncbi:MAG: glutaminyl-tRNA synthase (glutamine-hydrolyzing) subunit B [Parcubacteria group bacterium CG1_02_40_82]|uniref:Aspartyl/glutamyl-tRNA(Asn/Gln) amidotransferase subunit B n=2 Tax=Candidatus Portnoyibacteriota TaxID=1817913 RepID=A0A2H0KU86_9BACT|nr:MAG: glutaminyl-tRNA synthase (glutamine-hydrolyzing) subunit B [Parcubacteria group bacterium CG1_02_40_82]PIQ74865.1 MAG: Asp-tRNA(Asn)/Glu-tRNA(Gln) amidotransferase GatCAB subunit B [Candidatus Portnoybacteria bacterium CG11_big_fil_rev_8_21_14_0_20_40_15]PIS31055.1 MAG: Asp-tRNA(Asn)/Glu-tRNA(Gln) amidotransferase subunit GatB [Candidatus Portnoybacteria bacterium CG08_land_8_20_14_0_20_40_83]PIY74005.1 MAG: Asp-tRNA(Asn)/Glu-tRNA(Gln) amidotransferase subunit GatB [Candidatus Portnoybac